MYQIKTLLNIEDMLPHFSLIQQLGYTYNINQYKAYLEEMIPSGYRQMAVFVGEDCIAVAGYWFQTRLYCGKYVELDNVVVSSNYRSQGIGQLLCQAIEEEGQKNGCRVSNLNAYVSNSGAHRFYIKEGYRILGFHFTKQLIHEEKIN